MRITYIYHCPKSYKYFKNANLRHIYHNCVSPLNDVYSIIMKGVMPLALYEMSNELLKFLSAIKPLYMRLMYEINDDYD